MAVMFDAKWTRKLARDDGAIWWPFHFRTAPDLRFKLVAGPAAYCRPRPGFSGRCIYYTNGKAAKNDPTKNNNAKDKR